MKFALLEGTSKKVQSVCEIPNNAIDLHHMNEMKNTIVVGILCTFKKKTFI